MIGESKQILYHGSKIPNLKTLTPRAHRILNGEKVVFATSDIRFALTMIYGSGDEIAVGYNTNTKTNEEEMYIEELKPNKLKLLKSKGYLYQVFSFGFKHDSRLSHVELINYNAVEIIETIQVKNILEELKKYEISIITH